MIARTLTIAPRSVLKELRKNFKWDTKTPPVNSEKMGKVVVVKHSCGSAGRLAERLERAEVEWEEVNTASGETLPPVDEIGALVIMGGVMGAYDTEEHPYLLEEVALIREAEAEDIPVLGICLGAQLLAAALGGRAYLADQPEVGAVALELTELGQAHPVVSKIAGRKVFSMHQDTFDLPPRSELLARSDRFPHAFVRGSALGIQFHPETHNAEANEWAQDGARQLLDRAGTTPEEFAAQMGEAESEFIEGAHQLFDAWIAGLDA